MIDTLPLELLHIVLDHMTLRDLKNLSEASKSISEKTLPYLYGNFIIQAKYPSAPKLYSGIAKTNHSRLVHTKHLRLWGAYHQTQEKQTCSLHDFLEDDTTEPDCIPILIHDMHRKVSAIPEGQLQSFKWDLKTCLSDELVLLINKILETQVNITTISLLTDNDCVASSPRRPSCILNLAQLSKLQSLSWRGLKDHTDFESVKRFIAAHGAQLKTLHLDLIGWDSARLTWTEGHQKISSTDTWLPHNFFAQYVLGLQHSGVPCTLLPALQHLFLSQVAFTSMEVELVGALNIGRLQALQLVNCPGTFHFLRQIVRSGVPLRLKLLELTFNPEKLNQITDESQDNIAETVEALLKAFSSLTDLYLMLPTNAWDTLCKSAMHHKSLKRLITHWLVSTDWGSYSEGELFGPPERPCTISYYPGLEFLGVSTCIEDFDYKGGHTNHHDCLRSPFIKIIHLRANGPALQERRQEYDLSANYSLGFYAHWAFGPDGFSGLQVLAYGDFSHDGCYHDYNFFMCRKHDDGYELLTSRDAKYWDLVQENKDVLGACAFDELFLGRGMP